MATEEANLGFEKILDQIEENGLEDTLETVESKEIIDSKLQTLWENAKLAQYDLKEYLDELSESLLPAELEQDFSDDEEEAEVDLTEEDGDEEMSDLEDSCLPLSY